MDNRYPQTGSCFDGHPQGCPLSPTLFAVFIDGLIRRLKNSGLGLDVDGGNRLCSLLYADDIVVLAENEDDLDQLIQVVRDYQGCGGSR